MKSEADKKGDRWPLSGNKTFFVVGEFSGRCFKIYNI
jgi:hypothetical protein